MIKFNIKNKKGELIEPIYIPLLLLAICIIFIYKHQLINITGFLKEKMTGLPILISLFVVGIGLLIYTIISIIKYKKWKNKTFSAEEIIAYLSKIKWIDIEKTSENRYVIFKYDEILKKNSEEYYIELIFTPENKENFLVNIHSESRNKEIITNYHISKNNDFRKIIPNAVYSFYNKNNFGE